MIANKSIEKLEQSAVKLTITVGSEEAAGEYKDLIKKYAKDIQIKGFRKGKVPQSVLEQKFGEGIKEEAAGKIMDKALQEALESVEDKPLNFEYPVVQGEPKLIIGEDFTFDIVYDVFPAFELGEFKGTKITETQVKIQKKHEDAELEKIQDQNSVVVDKTNKTVAGKNIVTINYVELDDKKEELADSSREGFVFTVGTGQNYFKLDDDIKGMKVDGERVIEKEFPEDFENTELAGKKKSIKVKVTAVKEKQVPKLDDELAQDVSDKYETLDDLKKDIRSKLDTQLESKIKEKKITQVMDQLVEANPIDLPASMIKSELESSWKRFLQQSGTQEEQVLAILKMQGQSKETMMEQWKDDSAKSLKSQLIIQKIIETEKIEVSDEDLEEEIKKQAENYNMTVEDLKKSFGDNGLNEYIKSDLIGKKAYDLLLDSAKVTKGEKEDFSDFIQ